MMAGTFWILWLLALAGVLSFVVVSVAVRLTRGKYIFRPELAEATFAERWRSGRSLRNMMTRLGGANRCLWVTVTADSLLVGPHFPFNLMFLPERYGLEHRIKLADIRGVEQRRSLFGRPSVRVRFLGSDGEERTLELQLSDPQRFTAALAAKGRNP